MGSSLSWLGNKLARYLSQPVRDAGQAPGTPADKLLRHLQVGDVLLVEGHSRFSTVVKYLTQSTWSHSALFVGFRWPDDPLRSQHCFVEADVVEGVRSLGVQAYTTMHTRICRPVGLNQAEVQSLCDYVVQRLGNTYDLRNVLDLARYLLPLPPVPGRMRREFLQLGSGDPTRAICSTLIAEAFAAIAYPILPVNYALVDMQRAQSDYEQDAQWHLQLAQRHPSFTAPRDFDVSPYFQIIKPTIGDGFDFRVLQWLEPYRQKPKAQGKADIVKMGSKQR